MDEETTAHTGGLMVARPEGVLWRFDEGQRRARIRKDGGEAAVGYTDWRWTEQRRSAQAASSSPHPHKPVAAWARVRGFLAGGRGKTERAGGGDQR